MAEQEGDDADHPPEGDEGVALERDDGLGERQGDHVAGAAEREHGQRPPGDVVGAVHDVDDERPEHERAERADDTDDEHDQQQALEPAPELVELALGGQPAEARQQRGLDGLEHEQRDAGEQHGVGELRERAPCRRSPASSVVAIGPALSSAAANTDPSSSQPRFGVTSPHDASGPGSVRRLPLEYTYPTPTSGARATANPYGPVAATPATARTTHSTMRTTPSVPRTMA